MRAGLIVAAALMVSPAHACHRFSVWKFPFPQRCAVAHVDHAWFVEIGAPAVAAADERTPAQVSDQREHDEAVRQHKGELNDLLMLLQTDDTLAGTK